MSTALLAGWLADKLAKAAGSVLDPHEAGMFMQSRPHGMTIRDVVTMPTNFDL